MRWFADDDCLAGGLERELLDDSIAHRLPRFGTWQEAMVGGDPYLNDSLLSSSLDLHLVDLREAVEAALGAIAAGHREYRPGL